MLSRVGGPHPQVRVTDREEADGWISPEEETLKISPEEETQPTENKKSRYMQLLQPGRLFKLTYVVSRFSNFSFFLSCMAFMFECES